MNAVIWVTLPVCYFHLLLFLSWIGRGEGQMFLFRYFWRVMHSSFPGSERATTFFAKNSKIPRPTTPIKNVPSLIPACWTLHTHVYLSVIVYPVYPCILLYTHVYPSHTVYPVYPISCVSMFTQVILYILYSRLVIIRTFKGNGKKFELSGVRVIEGKII